MRLGMLNMMFLWLVSLQASLGCEDNQSLVGNWKVFENLSNNVYEMRFSELEVVRTQFRGEINVGNYEIECSGSYTSLKLKWPNGSESHVWVQYTGKNGEVRLYDRSVHELAPNFDEAFLLSKLERNASKQIIAADRLRRQVNSDVMHQE